MIARFKSKVRVGSASLRLACRICYSAPKYLVGMTSRCQEAPSNRRQLPSVLITPIFGAGYAVPNSAGKLFRRSDDSHPEKVRLSRFQQTGVHGRGPDRRIAAVNISAPQLPLGYAHDTEIVGGAHRLAQTMHVRRRVGGD